MARAFQPRQASRSFPARSASAMCSSVSAMRAGELADAAGGHLFGAHEGDGVLVGGELLRAHVPPHQGAGLHRLGRAPEDLAEEPAPPLRPADPQVRHRGALELAAAASPGRRRPSGCPPSSPGTRRTRRAPPRARPRPRRGSATPSDRARRAAAPRVCWPLRAGASGVVHRLSLQLRGVSAAQPTRGYSMRHLRLGCAIAALIAPVAIHAQETSSSIRGQVTNDAGAGIANATVATGSPCMFMPLATTHAWPGGCRRRGRAVTGALPRRAGAPRQQVEVGVDEVADLVVDPVGEHAQGHPDLAEQPTRHRERRPSCPSGP